MGVDSQRLREGRVVFSMGKDKTKRLEELINQVDIPGREESETTESGDGSPQSANTDQTGEINPPRAETTEIDKERDPDSTFPTGPVLEGKEEYLVSLLVSAGAGFVTFVILTYLLVVVINGYERINFFNSLLFSVVAFLYTFKRLAFTG